MQKGGKDRIQEKVRRRKVGVRGWEGNRERGRVEGKEGRREGWREGKGAVITPEGRPGGALITVELPDLKFMASNFSLKNCNSTRH